MPSIHRKKYFSWDLCGLRTSASHSSNLNSRTVLLLPFYVEWLAEGSQWGEFVSNHSGTQALYEIGYIFILSSAYLKNVYKCWKGRLLTTYVWIEAGRLIECKLTTHMLILTRFISRCLPLMGSSWKAKATSFLSWDSLPPRVVAYKSRHQRKKKKIYLLMRLIHPSRGHNIWVKLVLQLLEK